MRIGATALAALALFTSASDGLSATPTPNVRGVVLSGATAPGCYPGEPCDPPVKPAFLAFRRTGHALVRSHLGTHGGFALRLAPGWYALQLLPSMHGTKLKPSVVHVPASGTVQVTVHVTGPPAPE
jgi:hypothetical protein